MGKTSLIKPKLDNDVGIMRDFHVGQNFLDRANSKVVFREGSLTFKLVHNEATFIELSNKECMLVSNSL